MSKLIYDILANMNSHVKELHKYLDTAVLDEDRNEICFPIQQYPNELFNLVRGIEFDYIDLLRCMPKGLED